MGPPGSQPPLQRSPRGQDHPPQYSGALAGETDEGRLRPQYHRQLPLSEQPYLDFAGHREYQLANQLKLEIELQPELSRTEYLWLLQTARALGRERVSAPMIK